MPLHGGFRLDLFEVLRARLLELSGGTASFWSLPPSAASPDVFVDCGAREERSVELIFSYVTCSKKMTLCHVPWILFLEP